MLRFSHAILATVLFVLGVAGLLWALTFSPAFQNCHAAADQNNVKKEQQSTVPVGVWQRQSRLTRTTEPLRLSPHSQSPALPLSSGSLQANRHALPGTRSL